MVDIIKSRPNVRTSFPSNILNLRSKPFCAQITLPIYVTNTNNISQYDRINNINIKRWIDHCPSVPPRLFDITNSPYSLHRKIMYQELSRPCPISVDLSRSVKSRQQQRNTNKDAAKSSTTTITTTTTIVNGGTNITPQPSFNTSDAQSSRLFDTLSKHVTIKAEPLRPSNSFINSSTNTLTSWQRYWTSTHIQRRRKEATDAEPVLYRPKREQSIPGQTHFVVLRDSPNPYNELCQYDSRTPSTLRNIYSPTKSQISTTTTLDEQISTTNENDIKKETHQLSTIEFNALSLIPATTETNSSRIKSKTIKIIPLKSTDKDDGKHFTEKSLLFSSSSHFRSDSEIIEEVSQAQFQTKSNPIKVCKLPLPADKPKKIKKSPSRRRTRPKSGGKKETRSSSASKRKRQTSANRKSTNKSDLSTIITTTPRSRYSKAKWDEPYIGLRFDPPTPRSSPSLLVCLQDSDQEDNDTSYEKSAASEHSLAVKVLGS